MCATRAVLSFHCQLDKKRVPGLAISSPPPSQDSYRGYPINNFQLHLPLQSQPPSLRPSPVEFPPSLCSRVAPGAAHPLAALAGFAAHLAEVGSATELKFEHQGAVGHLVHILAFCSGGGEKGERSQSAISPAVVSSSWYACHSTYVKVRGQVWIWSSPSIVMRVLGTELRSSLHRFTHRVIVVAPLSLG